MPKVELKRITSNEDYDGEVVGLDILVDGKRIGYGSFGGEPEDNSELRDYNWVIPALKDLSETLGAEVIVSETEEC